ncbi:MAG: hypothetical protein QOE11_2288 [Solirubrobacteraceae bacterium]|jgi:quercetin dioxygenase-like cupin family protein|nr:hypothetical protein [Solirubrobacteraceae bacterium]
MQTTTTTTHLTTAETRARVVGPDQGEHLWFLRNSMHIKADAGTTGGAYGLVQSLVAPKFSPPLHVQDLEDEAFYVLEGNFTFLCGGERIAAGPGSYVFIPRGLPHSFINEDDTPGRLLTIITPGGGERFFADGGRPAEGDGLPPEGPPDIEALHRAAAAHGSRIIGPPMTPADTVASTS